MKWQAPGEDFDANPPPPSFEDAEVSRIYVDAGKSEYLDADAKITAKIEDLLATQEGIASGNDVEALFAASDAVAGANCHKTALYLTGKYTREQLFEPYNDDPKTAGHEFIEQNSALYGDPEALQAALRNREFPFRVSFFKPKDGKEFAYHSITVLGLSNKGTLVAFEKKGPYADTPFRYVNALNVIMSYLAENYVVGLEK